jgi:serine/threonine protein kinase
MELCECNLEDLVKNSIKRKISPEEARYYFRQLMEAIDYMHSKGSS